jgi:hypothetical protein
VVGVESLNEQRATFLLGSVQKPFPIAPIIVLLFMAAVSAVMAYVVWNGRGPKRWYSDTFLTGPFGKILGTLVPASFGLLGFAALVVARHARSGHVSHLMNHILLVVQIAGGVALAIGVVTALSVGNLGRPRWLIPPPFRSDR